tara:strand:+ start:58 stop:231 length:174 start_codon:yes stop_codon:yes gene_type:complete
MKIYKKFLILFEKILFFAIILTILSCNMNTNSNDKSNKIKNIEFKINKTVGVKLSND